ncbi:MAG: hypothetical protein K0R57_5655 [Paenibacillaceae bacterium]|jgi:uncharacterized protein YbbK (DUF523 family)|nr:hypothetical protein [Paenibacillaceae bacterium]
MKKIIVSSCLLGHRVRYDNKVIPALDPHLLRWNEEGRLIHICPEVAGGLPTPRPPAQIREGRVVTEEQTDVTAAFELGAQAALALALEHGAELAILKQSSPSCGSLMIYDGTFTGRKIPGEGWTAALLRKHGIKVFGEDQLDEVVRELLHDLGPA